MKQVKAKIAKKASGLRLSVYLLYLQSEGTCGQEVCPGQTASIVVDNISGDFMIGTYHLCIPVQDAVVSGGRTIETMQAPDLSYLPNQYIG